MDQAAIEIGKRWLGAMEERGGLPRPDWGRVQRRWWSLPEGVQPAAWTAVEWVWQHALAEAWRKRSGGENSGGTGGSSESGDGNSGGGGFRVVERGECLLTTDLDDVEAERTAVFMGRALGTIERCLTGLGLPEFSDGGPGLDVAVVCREVEDYLDYVSDAHEADHVGAVSGGMCLHDGSVHVAAHGRSAGVLGPVLAHELAHSRLAGLGLPVWLEEGLVVHLEKAVVPNEDFENDLHTVAQHRRFWTPGRLGAFFGGEVFCGADDAEGLPYALAYSIVGELMRSDAERFAEFIKAASWEDGGAGACVALYGQAPEGLIPRFIRDAAEANAGSVDDHDITDELSDGPDTLED
ncbi:MAG: hypothetical protein AAGH99_08350 [Planctomycetota bacterium]